MGIRKIFRKRTPENIISDVHEFINEIYGLNTSKQKFVLVMSKIVDGKPQTSFLGAKELIPEIITVLERLR